MTQHDDRARALEWAEKVFSEYTGFGSMAAQAQLPTIRTALAQSAISQSCGTKTDAHDILDALRKVDQSPTITVWKDGGHKLWGATDAKYTEGDPDWLCTIALPKAYDIKEMADYIQSLREPVAQPAREAVDVEALKLAVYRNHLGRDPDEDEIERGDEFSWGFQYGAKESVDRALYYLAATGHLHKSSKSAVDVPELKKAYLAYQEECEGEPQDFKNRFIQGAWDAIEWLNDTGHLRLTKLTDAAPTVKDSGENEHTHAKCEGYPNCPTCEETGDSHRQPGGETQPCPHPSRYDTGNCCGGKLCPVKYTDGTYSRELEPCPNGLQCSGDGSDCVGDARCGQSGERAPIDTASAEQRPPETGPDIEQLNRNNEKYGSFRETNDDSMNSAKACNILSSRISELEKRNAKYGALIERMASCLQELAAWIEGCDATVTGSGATADAYAALAEYKKWKAGAHER